MAVWNGDFRFSGIKALNWAQRTFTMFVQTRLFYNGAPVFTAVPYNDNYVWRAFARNKGQLAGGLDVKKVLHIYSIITGDERRVLRHEA